MSKGDGKAKLSEQIVDTMDGKIVQGIANSVESIISIAFEKALQDIADRCDKRARKLAKEAGVQMDNWSMALQSMVNETDRMKQARAAFANSAETELKQLKRQFAIERLDALRMFREILAASMTEAALRLESK